MQADNAYGSNSIPTNILKTFKKELSKPLRINLSFWTETFPETIKIAKRIPVFKKDDNLGCNNVEQYYYYLIWAKYLEN